MTGRPELSKLPPNLPTPVDDGGARHLVGCRIPAVTLPDSRGKRTALERLRGTVVLYVFPMMGRPDVPLPESWNETPGARGCTVQSLRYNRDLKEFARLGVKIYGISAQSPDDQREAADRLGLRQILLSDQDGTLWRQLGLPTFEIEGGRYLRRLTMVVVGGTIERVWYPVFPPGEDVTAVREWIEP